MADAPRITAQQLKQTMDAGEDITIVDVRNPQAWSQSGTMMPGAIRVPVQEWQQHLPRIPKDRPVDLRPLPGVPLPARRLFSWNCRAEIFPLQRVTF